MNKPVSSMSTRRQLKTKKLLLPKCCYCQKEPTINGEPVKQCVACESYFHIKACLKYVGDFADRLAKQEAWHCPRCVRCDGCRGIIDDPTNVECEMCCKAWHGGCSSGLRVSEEYSSAYYCSLCAYKNGLRRDMKYSQFSYAVAVAASEPTKPARTARQTRPVKQAESPLAKPVVESDDDEEILEPLEFEPEMREYLTDLLNQRDKIFARYNKLTGLSGELSEDPKGKKRQPDAFPPFDTDITHKDKDKRIRQLTLPVDRELHSSARAEAYANEPVRAKGETGQWLHFATENACKALCKSAYKEPLQSAPHLFICKFCLHTTNLLADFDVHFAHCDIRYPPGNEIYRKDRLAFFEVDGTKQKGYCQRLCLIAKLFISSKTLYIETETFTFYVLCEIKQDGYVLVGYFSKEKNPSKNNNLSCLLVLPQAQKMGYGRMLIDMSYELSRLEHRVGHPEHPLSDLGILAYRGYWRSSLLCYLRSLKNTENITMKEICLQTRITLVDIANQMMLDNLIVFKNSKYYIKIGKRALKYPLSACRRRAVDTNCINWGPLANGETLDPRKINTYI